jgi:chromatin segregation and condensation protein Rec8/ScpA/Scc1 (kleisin family)
MTESESLHPLPRIVLKNLFEGPLDLLLHLIKVNEMDITEVSLADVTQQYLMYLDAMKVLDLEVAGEFLVIAATLLSIKSRSLLPAQPGEEGEEEGEEVDAALSTRQLLRRLIESANSRNWRSACVRSKKNTAASITAPTSFRSFRRRSPRNRRARTSVRSSTPLRACCSSPHAPDALGAARAIPRRGQLVSCASACVRSAA